MPVIYFDEKPLYLTGFGKGLSASSIHRVEDPQHLNWDTILDELLRVNCTSLALESADPDALFQSFQQRYDKVQAAGGVVEDGNSVLLIHRRGKWDLPKGKLDEGETLEACALREIREETGLKTLELGELLMVTWHTYQYEGRPSLKESFWYRVRGTQQELLAPQEEEDIDQCIWVEKQALKAYRSGTHASLRPLFDLVMGPKA